MSSNPQPLPPGLDSLTREELPKMPKAVADALDDWIMRRFGKESSHHGAGLFLNLLAEEGYEVTPQASSAERSEEEEGSLRSGPSANGPRCDVYVTFSNEPVKRTHTRAGDTINVDVDEYGVPVGVELVGAMQVQINGQSVTPAPSFPEGDYVDHVSQVLRGYRIKLGANALSLIKDGHWHSVPLSLGEMRDIAWLLQEAGLLREAP